MLAVRLHFVDFRSHSCLRHWLDAFFRRHTAKTYASSTCRRHAVYTPRWHFVADASMLFRAVCFLPYATTYVML